MTTPATPGRALTVLVWTAAVGILLQAVSAGQFVSGLSNAVGVHSVVGTVLELVGLILVVAAVLDRRTRQHRRGWWRAALLLGVALLVQAGLGHAPGALPTAIHVPVGVALFAWATVLAIAQGRPGRPASPAAGERGRGDTRPARERRGSSQQVRSVQRHPRYTPYTFPTQRGVS